MSMAVNMIRKKTGDTSANSTSAWLRCPPWTCRFSPAPNRCAKELSNSSTPQSPHRNSLSAVLSSVLTLHQGIHLPVHWVDRHHDRFVLAAQDPLDRITSRAAGEVVPSTLDRVERVFVAG